MEFQHLRNIERWTLLLVPIAAAVGLFFGIQASLGAVLGAALTAANFAGIRRIAEKVAGASSRRQTQLMLLLVVKFGALVTLVALVIHYAPVNRIAFLIGFSSFMVAIGFEWARMVLGDQGTETT